MLGDIFHDLRTSLDHLAEQIIIAGGGTPNERSGFPVSDSRQGDRAFSPATGPASRPDGGRRRSAQGQGSDGLARGRTEKGPGE